MRFGFLRRAALWLAMPWLLLAGCSTSGELPPGGADAVAYWQKLLLQYPDLPDRVRDVVDGRGQVDWSESRFPQSEVRIHGQDGAVTVTGRRIDVLITDLDDATLRQLLAWWEAVPAWADKLGLGPPTLPFHLPENTRHIVVLGSQGRIEVDGPDQRYRQSVQVLADEVAAKTTIGIHTFGSEGQSSLNQMASQYQSVRGPPRSEVKAGRISLPPPEDNITVLVVGQLQSLDIHGPADDAQQEISFAAYLNSHQDSSGLFGTLAGTPFATGSTDPTEVSEPPVGNNGDYAHSTNGTTSSGTTSSTTPQVPNWTPPTTMPLPGNIPWQPPFQMGTGPGLVVPPLPPIYVPPRVVTPPVTRFR